MVIIYLIPSNTRVFTGLLKSISNRKVYQRLLGKPGCRKWVDHVITWSESYPVTYQSIGAFQLQNIMQVSQGFCDVKSNLWDVNADLKIYK